MDTTAKVTLTGTRPGKKRIAIFLDGTWNTVNDNTNVWRLKSLLADAGSDGVPQLGYYQKGVGTTFGSYFLGGVLGSGLQDEIITAYEWLIDHYSEGDELFIFGFSRGAYTARSLSGLISKCGLITIGAPLSVKQLYDRYRKAGVPLTIRQLQDQQAQGKTDFGFEERWILKYALPIDIDFLGVWDTVGALGLPFGNLPILGRQDMRFLNTGLRTSNKFAFHAMAINENRKIFAPTLWTVDYPNGAPPPHHHRILDQVEQRWFIGAHANVGGGYESDPLPQAPLGWIVDRAVRLGLTFRRTIDLDPPEKPPSQIYDSWSDFAYGTYKQISPRYWRPIGPEPAASSASEMRENINETIDASVFARWRDDPGFRPPNLADWAGRRKVDLDKVTGSVAADTAAPVP
jgi:uncharacterized protein (DUF2235 family)